MKKVLLLTGTGLLFSLLSFGQGIIRGKVSDKNGETLIGVIVVLKSNPSVGANTDLDGNFSLKITDSVPQTLVVSYVSYKTVEEVVHPVKGEVIIKDFVLESASQDLGVVEVVAKSTKAKEYYMENLKKNSSVTLDFISSETMKKTGDANVTAAISRVSGVSTTSSNGFITIRGIGDRFVKTTINGLRIPTLDPYTNNIKLDMFPSSLVDNVIISKTASPELPGDWAGAYISVETKDYPEKLAVNVESSFGYNNQSTFKNVLSSQRSSTDWLGYDNNLRDHTQDANNPVVTANIAPTKYQQYVALGLGDYYKSIGVNSNTPWSETYNKLGLVELGLLPKAQFNDATAVTNAKEKYYNGTYEKDAFNIINAESSKKGRSFPDNWNTTTRKAPLNFTQSFSVGDQFNIFGRPFGFITGFRYGSSIQFDPESTIGRAGVNADGSRKTVSGLNQQASRETNGWSALVNLAYKFNTNNSVSLLFMPNLTGVNNVRNGVGPADDQVNSRVSTFQFYEQRKQLVYQLKTEHYIPSAKTKIELSASYTNGKSKAPDFKITDYQTDPVTGTGLIGPTIGTGIHRYYRYLSDNTFDSKLSAEIPIWEKAALPRKLKFGGAYQRNDRKSDQYDYTLLFGSGGSKNFEGGDLNQLFSLNGFDIQTKVDPYGREYSIIDYYYSETGSPVNHTFGKSTVKAGFLMTDFTIIPTLRFSGGLRVEQAKIFTDVKKYDSLAYPANDQRRVYNDAFPFANPANLNGLNYLPSLSLIYKLRNNDEAPMNLRVNYSQTVARPSIRELSDVAVFDYEFRVNVVGNSELKMVNVKNYDLRYEAYFKNKDNISVSAFYKDFKNNIELVNSGFYTWQNVGKSTVVGIELEGKKSITKYFDFSANVSLINSQTSFVRTRIDITEGIKKEIPTNGGIVEKRTMFGQAPYIINGILSYHADSIGLVLTVSYNVQGPRLVLVSSVKEIPNVYELSRHLVNFKVSKTLGKHFGVSVTVQDILNAPIRRAYKYPEGFTYLDYDKYRYGTNYQLSFSYKL